MLANSVTIVSSIEKYNDYLENQILLYKNEIMELRQELMSKDKLIKELETQLNQMKGQTTSSFSGTDQQNQFSHETQIINSLNDQRSIKDNQNTANQIIQFEKAIDSIDTITRIESEDEDMDYSSTHNDSSGNIQADDSINETTNTQIQQANDNSINNTTNNLTNLSDCVRATVDVTIKNGHCEMRIRNKEPISNENRLMCPCCTHTFYNKRGVRHHIRRNHLCKLSDNKILYRCHICEERFQEMDALSQHLVTHKSNAVECKHCHALFRDKSTLANHTRHNSCVKLLMSDSSTHNDSSGNIQTDNSVNETTNAHDNSIDSTIDNLANLSGCARATVEMKVKNGRCEVIIKNTEPISNENRLMCPCCTHTFHNKKSIRQHIRRTHFFKFSDNKVLYRCHICEKQFLEMEKLSRHLVTHRSSAAECKRCHALFKDRSTLANHTRHNSCIKLDDA